MALLHSNEVHLLLREKSFAEQPEFTATSSKHGGGTSLRSVSVQRVHACGASAEAERCRIRPSALLFHLLLLLDANDHRPCCAAVLWNSDYTLFPAAATAFCNTDGTFYEGIRLLDVAAIWDVWAHRQPGRLAEQLLVAQMIAEAFHSPIPSVFVCCLLVRSLRHLPLSLDVFACRTRSHGGEMKMWAITKSRPNVTRQSWLRLIYKK